MDLARLLSENPARRFGLYPKKGVIAIGSDADLTVIDLNHEWVIKADELIKDLGGRRTRGIGVGGEST